MSESKGDEVRVQELLGMGRDVWRRLRDPTVPARHKAIPLVALLYVVSPIDIVPDAVLGLGQLDDIAVLVIALRLFLSLSNKEPAARKSDAGEQVPLEATYRVHDE